MQEKEIQMPAIDPLEFFGPANNKFKLIKKYFPRLKVMAHGNVVRAIGDEEELERFSTKIDLLFWHIEKYNSLTEGNIEKIMEEGSEKLRENEHGEGILVHGPGGNKVTARTANQRKLVKASEENDMVFAVGPAGSGKTYTAVALAVRALKNREVKRIILCRPAVEAGENLGFLPGDLKEKLDPYLQPLYDALMDMIPYEKLADHLDKGVIEVAPLAFMRGRTLDKAFVILDEAQNATVPQIKMFLTRMGKTAKFIITGDPSQVDLPRSQPSGLARSMELLDKVEGIQFVKLTGSDVIRHKLVKKIIKVFENDK